MKWDKIWKTTAILLKLPLVASLAFLPIGSFNELHTKPWLIQHEHTKSNNCRVITVMPKKSSACLLLCRFCTCKSCVHHKEFLQFYFANTQVLMLKLFQFTLLLEAEFTQPRLLSFFKSFIMYTLYSTHVSIPTPFTPPWICLVLYHKRELWCP